MLAGAVAHATGGKPSTFKASELQREIEHVTSELTKSTPNLRNGDNNKAREIQTEVEFMVSRVESLHDSELMSEFTDQLEVVEEAVSKETTDRRMTTEISEVRASLCAQNGFQNHEFAECEAFMRKSCEPKNTDDANFVNDEPLEDFCYEFFHQEKVFFHQAARAPAPGPAAGPGGAPGPAPMGTLFGGKNLRELPDQGFDGKLVKHADFDTMNEDWQKEFGPKSGHRDFDEICADFPDNEWCRIHGYHPYPERETKVVTETETVEVPAAEEEPEPPKPAEEEKPPPPAPQRSGSSSCQLTLTAFVVAASVFAK